MSEDQGAAKSVGRGALLGQQNVNQPKRMGRGEILKMLREQAQAKKSGIGEGDAESFLKKAAVEEAPRKIGRGRAAQLFQSVSEPLQEFTSQIKSALPETRVKPMLLEKDREPVIKRGSDGEKVPLMANFIALHCDTKGVYQYHVGFEPMMDCRLTRAKMVHGLTRVIGDTNAFDGFNLYLPKQLEENPTILSSERATDGARVEITLTLVKVLAPDECVHLYNIIFKKIMSKLSMVQMGRNYFLPSGRLVLKQHNLEVWPSNVTSISNYEGGVMLNLDVSHRVLRTQTALELMIDLMSTNKASKREDVHKLLIGNMVLTRYNNKVYRIDDVNWSMNPKSTFTMHDGETITFVEYYKRMYNIVIEDHEQPLLISMPKKKADQAGNKRGPDLICLVPELSFMTGLTDLMRSDFRVMKELSNHTRLTPMQRHSSFKKFVTEVNNIPEARRELEKWGFKMDNDIMEIEGRRLKTETILFFDKEVYAGLEADWSKATTKSSVLNSVDVDRWILVVTQRDFPKARDFISTYQQCAGDMGISVQQPNLVVLDDDRTTTYINEIRRHIHDNIQLVVCIFPSQREDRYNSVKRICSVERAVPSQVINAGTLSDSRKLRSVTQKLALQINCKLGGELWGVKIPAKSLMVCGVDVYHDPGRWKSSVVGFVSSMNSTCTRWYSKVGKQEPGEELINSLKSCFVHALQKYYEVNHEFPARIVIYRDGVGDGQLKVVKDYEVEQLKQCFDNFKQFDYQPKLAVIVVQKRINTRLLANEMGELTNPDSGTVVDHTITRRYWYDFFLVSQHIRQGTVTPSHYVVVHDDLGWKPDIVQALTYKMTHLYYNWPGTIRVPAPCQYAHKLAYLVGQNIKEEPSPQLSQTLHFL